MFNIVSRPFKTRESNIDLEIPAKSKFSKGVNLCLLSKSGNFQIFYFVAH